MNKCFQIIKMFFNDRTITVNKDIVVGIIALERNRLGSRFLTFSDKNSSIFKAALYSIKVVFQRLTTII